MDEDPRASVLPMQTDPQNRWKKLRPGLWMSVALHIVLAAILFLRLPDAPPTPPEEAVPVEMVQAPPEKKPEPPAQKTPRAQAKPAAPPAKSPPPPAKQPPAETKPEPAPPPAAFQSASKEGDKEPAPAGEIATPEKVDPQPAPPEVSQKADAASDATTPDTAVPAPQSQSAAADKAPTPPDEVKEKPAAALPALTLPQARKPTDDTFAEPDAARTQNPAEPGPPADLSPARDKPATPSPSPPPAVAPAKTPSVKPPAATPPTAKLAKAKKLYSADALSNPRLREALGTLPPDSRLVQICSIEALEQIRHGSAGHVPDLFAAASPTGRQIKGNQFQASGGAFRSKGIWYDVTFSCSADPKTYAVTSFRFVIGNAVPKSQWTTRQFPRN